MKKNSNIFNNSKAGIFSFCLFCFFALITTTAISQTFPACEIDKIVFSNEKVYRHLKAPELPSAFFSAQINQYYIADKPDTLLLLYTVDNLMLNQYNIADKPDTLLLQYTVNNLMLTSQFPLPLKSSYNPPLYLLIYFKDCKELPVAKIRITKIKVKHYNKPERITSFRIQRLLHKLKQKYDNAAVALTQITPALVDKPQKDALDERKESAQNKVVIDKREFEKFGYFTAGEIIRTLPGVYFEDPSENSLVNFRGAPSGYTQILIDGERLPDGQENRAFQIDRIPASMIERIEIIRSPGAAQDAQGIAGTINIILKKSQNTPRHELSASYGHNYTKGTVYQASGISDISKNNLRFQPKIAYQKRGNGRDKFKSETSDIKNDKLDNDLREIFYEEIAFTPNFTYNIKPNHRLNINPLLLFSEGKGFRNKTGMQEVFIPGVVSDSMAVNNREEEFSYRKRNTTAIRGNYRWKVDKHLELNTFVSLNHTLQNIDIKKTKLFDEEFYNTTNRNIDKVEDRDAFTKIGFVYTPSKFWEMTGAVESSRKNRFIDRQKETNGWVDRIVMEELYTFREFRTNWIINNAFKFKKMRFDVGLRGEFVKSENTVTTNYFTNFMLIEKPITKEGRAANIDPYFNFNYKLKPDFFVKTIARLVKSFYKNELDSLKNKLNRNVGDIRFKPNLTRAVKRPTFTDLNPFVEYRDGTWLNPDKGGNPDLKPETSWGLDLAMEYYPKDKKGVFGINYYLRYITNMVAKGVDIDPWSERFTERPLNIGNGTMYGLELDFNYKIKYFKSYLLTTRGNFTLPKSSIKDTKTGQSKSFKNQPDYFYNIGFDLSGSKKFKPTIGTNYNHYPGFLRDNFKADGSRQKVTQMPIYRIDAYLGFSPVKNLFCRLTAQNFIRSQKYKEDIKFFTDGTVEQIKTDREIFRPVYNITLNYKF